MKFLWLILWGCWALIISVVTLILSFAPAPTIIYFTFIVVGFLPAPVVYLLNERDKTRQQSYSFALRFFIVYIIIIPSFLLLYAFLYDPKQFLSTMINTNKVLSNSPFSFIESIRILFLSFTDPSHVVR